jgi:hypothetical protein
MTPTDARSATGRLRAWFDEEPPDPRCPRCGAGDLFVTRVLRGASPPVDVEFCVGIYDRSRRRFVRRSCGYAGPPAAPPA